MALRNYSNLTPPMTLTSAVSNSAVSLPVSSTAGCPSVPFTAGVARQTPKEEVVLVTAVAPTALTVTRGYDGTTGVGHDPVADDGVAIEHCVCAIDYREANAHVNDNTNDVHMQYILKSLFTGKGYLIGATAAATPGSLAPGADGLLLTASSGASLGVAWAQVLPPASLILYAGGSPYPAGWYLADGSVVSISGDTPLYNEIGTTYNVGGEGVGNFRLPNFLGRSPIGAGQGSGLTLRALGASGGEEAHVLSIAEMPSHTHPSSGSGPFGDYVFAGANNNAGLTLADGGTIGNALWAQGGSGSHNNMQPFLAVNILIKR